MRLMLAALMAALVGGLASAQDKKKECALAGIMCPAKGCCEGACREFCDRGGEALVSLRTKVAASLKSAKSELASHAGVCKTKECASCATVEGAVIPVLKGKISARFGEMNKDVKHEVGKKSVACTFLTGKLCDPCVETMQKDVLAKIDEAKKDQK